MILWPLVLMHYWHVTDRRTDGLPELCRNCSTAECDENLSGVHTTCQPICRLHVLTHQCISDDRLVIAHYISLHCYHTPADRFQARYVWMSCANVSQHQHLRWLVKLKSDDECQLQLCIKPTCFSIFTKPSATTRTDKFHYFINIQFKWHTVTSATSYKFYWEFMIFRSWQLPKVK